MDVDGLGVGFVVLLGLNEVVADEVGDAGEDHKEAIDDGDRINDRVKRIIPSVILSVSGPLIGTVKANLVDPKLRGFQDPDHQEEGEADEVGEPSQDHLGLGLVIPLRLGHHHVHHYNNGSQDPDHVDQDLIRALSEVLEVIGEGRGVPVSLVETIV